MDINEMEYGYCFHVYLRKMSDTEWSGLLWNMINCLSTLDEEAPREHRVWPAFAQWCDACWKANPETPFYDVAAAWARTFDGPWDGEHEVPCTGAGIMFSRAILLCDEETREHLNAAARHDLGSD